MKDEVSFLSMRIFQNAGAQRLSAVQLRHVIDGILFKKNCCGYKTS